MSYCPADATSGFIQLTGPITQTKLNQISQKRHPFRTSFTPRTTPATLAQFHISDNANNTCIVNHVTYTVIDIQICKPVHTGYLLPGTTESPSAEMIVSCTAANEVSGMLLCVPIYNTGSARNNQYLSQVIHQPNTINIATLDTVFINQPSFRYRTCFETIHPQNGPSTHSIYVHVFPKGVHLSNSDYTALTRGTLPRFGIPVTLRDAEPTVQTYTFTNGNKTSTANSSDGFVYTVSIYTSDDEFTRKIEYFTEGPIPVKTTTKKKGLYTPDQYKCVPFDQTKNLIEETGIIYVTPGATNTTLTKYMADQQQKQSSNSSATDSHNVEKIETIIGSSVVGACVLIILGGVVYSLKK